MFQAINWIAARSPEVIIEKREAMIASIEAADAALRASGLQKVWFGDADATLLAVAGGCNGHLLEQLLVASDYHDVACVELLREGARLALRPPIFLYAHVRCTNDRKTRR